ncbi:septum formation family protein [Arthrobacter sp. TMS2-4]
MSNEEQAPADRRHEPGRDPELDSVDGAEDAAGDAVLDPDTVVLDDPDISVETLEPELTVSPGSLDLEEPALEPAQISPEVAEAASLDEAAAEARAVAAAAEQAGSLVGGPMPADAPSVKAAPAGTAPAGGTAGDPAGPAGGRVDDGANDAGATPENPIPYVLPPRGGAGSGLPGTSPGVDPDTLPDRTGSSAAGAPPESRADPDGDPAPRAGRVTTTPAVDPTGEPAGAQAVDPTGALASAQAVDPTGEPAGAQAVDPTSEPDMDPTGEPAGAQAVDPTSEPDMDPTDDRVGEPTGDTHPERDRTPSGSGILPLALLVGGALLLLGLLVWLLISLLGGPEDENRVDPSSLAAGECLAEFTDITEEAVLVDCAEPHNAQLVGNETYADGAAFPGRAQLGLRAEAACAAASAGIDPDAVTEDLGVTLLHATPTEATWADGDRRVDCFAVVEDGGPVSRSLLSR